MKRKVILRKIMKNGIQNNRSVTSYELRVGQIVERLFRRLGFDIEYWRIREGINIVYFNNVAMNGGNPATA